MIRKHQEHDIEDVFRYFVKGFKFKKGERLIDFGTCYDNRTGKVIFTLILEDGKKEAV